MKNDDKGKYFLPAVSVINWLTDAQISKTHAGIINGFELDETEQILLKALELIGNATEKEVEQKTIDFGLKLVKKGLLETIESKRGKL